MKNLSLFIKLCFIPYWDEMDDTFMKWTVHEAALGRPEQLATVASAGLAWPYSVGFMDMGH